MHLFAIPMVITPPTPVQFLTFNESPVFLHLDPRGLGGRDIPVTLYETITETVQGQPQTLFLPLDYTVESGEAERISVEHVAKTQADNVQGSQCRLTVWSCLCS